MGASSVRVLSLVFYSTCSLVSWLLFLKLCRLPLLLSLLRFPVLLLYLIFQTSLIFQIIFPSNSSQPIICCGNVSFLPILISQDLLPYVDSSLSSLGLVLPPNDTCLELPNPEFIKWIKNDLRLWPSPPQRCLGCS